MDPATTASKHARDVSQPHGPHGRILTLTVGALGVVFGDIGTSPLYAINQIFFGLGAVPVTPDNILGAISLVIWGLTLVIALKYLVLVLRADNDGEGGVFALYGLLHSYKRAGLAPVLAFLMLAAGLLFGDGVITPAISVLSAVEGLNVATPLFDPWVVPITLAVLTGLFAIQHQGTARVGSVFGPIILVWFLLLGFLGGFQIFHHPEILAALDPLRGLSFLHRLGLHPSLLVLGAVMLAVTGGEALYADMGHFGRWPIRLGWFGLVYPTLLLNYLGQGAFLLSGESVIGQNVFYSTVPRILLFPVIILATAATVIAAQALISGAYSLASQAIALGLFPRLRIVHTHQVHEGQIYAPFINWMLYAGCVLLVIQFRSSNALASAYGLAVSGVMLATSLAMLPVARIYWGWGQTLTILVFGPLAVIDATFLVANSFKLIEGGFVPLSIGAAVYAVMVSWRWGRKSTFAAYSRAHTMTMKQLVELKQQSTTQIDRNLVLMVPKPLRSEDENTPALFQFFWNRFGMLPQNLIFVEVVHRKVPYVHHERYHITEFFRDREKGNVISVTIMFGFMEEPNVEKVLEQLAHHHEIDLPRNPHRWIVHVSVEQLLPSRELTLIGRFRLRLFSILRQLSQPAYFYYGLGNEVQLTMEIMPVRIH
jgi:KUP system potassium uptake protein